MKLFASIFGIIGEFVAKTTAGACWFGMWDEEEMPESLLK